MVLTASSVSAQEDPSFRYPPPEFETGHELPADNQAPAREGWKETTDIVLLAVFLAAASWLVLKKRSRKGVVFLSVCALVYFGFYRMGCICAIGAVQNVALGLADASYTVPAGAVFFFALPLLFTLFFGRSFCAAVCPHGAIQDAVALKPIKVPLRIERILAIIPWLYLGLAVFLAVTDTMFIMCTYDPFVSLFRLSGGFLMLLFGGALMVTGIFIARPYCRFLCPFGLLLGLVSRISRYSVSITPDECVQCGLCEDSCPVGAICTPGLKKSVSTKAKYLILSACIVITAGSTAAGYRIGAALSVCNREVRLGRKLENNISPDVGSEDLEIQAIAKNRLSRESLIARAELMENRFAKGGLWLGAWLGIGISVIIMGFARRREYEDYQPDPARCVSCARCYAYCPRSRDKEKSDD